MTALIKTPFLTKDRDFYKGFFHILFYIVLQSLISCCVNLLDNIMLGAYSEAALSGVSLAGQIQFLYSMIIGGVSEGIVVLCSQYWGAGQREPIRKVISIGLIFGMITGFIFMLAVLFFPEPLLRLFSDDQAIIDAGMEYIRIIAPTYLLLGATQLLVAGMRSVENVRIGMIVTSTALLVNLGLNYLLIFGRFGFPELGIKGAAIATLFSRVIELGLLLGYIFFKEKELKYRPRHLLSFDKPLFKDYMRVSYPLILSGMTWGLAMSVQAVILGRLGPTAIAANAISASLFGVASVVAYAGASAASITTGKAVGMNNTVKLREYVRTMQIIFLLIGVVSGSALYLCRDFILGFYQISPDTLALSQKFVNILSITLMGTAYQVACLTGIVRGGGHTKFVFYNDLIFMWLIVLPGSFLCAFVFDLPPEIVFFCLKSDQILKCFVAVFEVNSYRWVRKLTRKAEPGETAEQA